MFCLSKDQYEKYKQYMETELNRIKLSRVPGKLYKYNPGSLVHTMIDFKLDNNIMIAEYKGVCLGKCGEPDPEGLTIQMSEEQVKKYKPQNGHTIEYNPGMCLSSKDPILTVKDTRSNRHILSLNDDLDIMWG